jgi:predicted ATPase
VLPVDLIATLQRARQLSSTAAGVQFFDRSPLCTFALARYLAHPVTACLAAEVSRIIDAGTYAHSVFLVRPLRFITPTPARQISYAESVTFEAVHEQVYQEHGFELVDIPAGIDPAHRATIIEAHVARVG